MRFEGWGESGEISKNFTARYTTGPLKATCVRIECALVARLIGGYNAKICDGDAPEDSHSIFISFDFHSFFDFHSITADKSRWHLDLGLLAAV